MKQNQERGHQKDNKTDTNNRKCKEETVELVQPRGKDETQSNHEENNESEEGNKIQKTKTVGTNNRGSESYSAKQEEVEEMDTGFEGSFDACKGKYGIEKKK